MSYSIEVLKSRLVAKQRRLKLLEYEETNLNGQEIVPLVKRRISDLEKAISILQEMKSIGEL